MPAMNILVPFIGSWTFEVAEAGYRAETVSLLALSIVKVRASVTLDSGND